MEGSLGVHPPGGLKIRLEAHEGISGALEGCRSPSLQWQALCDESSDFKGLGITDLYRQSQDPIACNIRMQPVGPTVWDYI